MASDFLECPWCETKMTLVWVNHAVVVRGNVLAGPMGQRRVKSEVLKARALNEGMYLECSECGEFCAFEPIPNELREI